MKYLTLNVIFFASVFRYVLLITLEDDPSLWPGHMEPFAAKQKHVAVEVLNEWPSPIGMKNYYTLI